MTDKPLTTMELAEILLRPTGRSKDDNRVVVRIHSPGGIGGTPCVNVLRADYGFDWDNGKLMLSTDRPVTALSPEDVAAINKSAQEGQSWHAYKATESIRKRNIELIAENARLQKRIEQLEQMC